MRIESNKNIFRIFGNAYTCPIKDSIINFDISSLRFFAVRISWLLLMNDQVYSIKVPEF